MEEPLLAAVPRFAIFSKKNQLSLSVLSLAVQPALLISVSQVYKSGCEIHILVDAAKEGTRLRIDTDRDYTVVQGSRDGDYQNQQRSNTLVRTAPGDLNQDLPQRLPLVSMLKVVLWPVKLAPVNKVTCPTIRFSISVGAATTAAAKAKGRAMVNFILIVWLEVLVKKIFTESIAVM